METVANFSFFWGVEGKVKRMERNTHTHSISSGSEFVPQYMARNRFLLWPFHPVPLGQLEMCVCLLWPYYCQNIQPCLCSPQLPSLHQILPNHLEFPLHLVLLFHFATFKTASGAGSPTSACISYSFFHIKNQQTFLICKVLKFLLTTRLLLSICNRRTIYPFYQSFYNMDTSPVLYIGNRSEIWQILVLSIRFASI